MDGQRFDDLTKTLATRATRRRALTGLLGAAAGGALSLVGRRSSLAADPPLDDCVLPCVVGCCLLLGCEGAGLGQCIAGCQRGCRAPEGIG